MFALPEMLIPAANAAGIDTPENLESFDQNAFPHWVVYCSLQLGSSMPYPSCHFDNAEIVAKIPNDEIRLVSAKDILDMGFSIGYSKL